MSAGWSGQFQDTLYNTPVQRTAADITKKALGLLPERLADTGAKIIGTVHDEIILEVPEGVAVEAAVTLKETMIQAGKAYLSRVPVEVEVTIADTLGREVIAFEKNQNRVAGLLPKYLKLSKLSIFLKENTQFELRVVGQPNLS